MGYLHELHSTLQPLTFRTDKDPVVTKPDLTKYLKFYSIDFAKKLDVEHRIGIIRAAGFKVVTHYWNAPEARGTVFIFHGYFDHVGLYGQLIQWCLKEHYNVVAIDLPGHGLSSGEQASIESFDQYGAVLKTLVSLCSKTQQKPFFCIAQDIGATAVMNMMWKHNKRPFAKMIFLAPFLRPQGWFKGKIWYRISKLFVKSIKRRIVPNTGNRQFNRFVGTKDPLQSKRQPIEWQTAMQHWMDEFPSLPTEIVKPLIIQGDEDVTLDWKYNIKQIEAHFPNVITEYLPGANHHLTNEVKNLRNNMFKKIKTYLDLQILEPVS
ncbi:MAG: alpha/beta hydrolase [bacterium]|nr:alpha/beta hydrolase [Gammaproteobacteria bacterium]HIL97649.1 alpha/beta hydrolase [Pseudomonadales bacterium]